MASTTVAIVGGGYGGIALAKALDPTLDVVLIDPKDSFVHAVAALRGVVDGDWAPRIFFDFNRLLARGRFVRDRAVAVDEGGVTTATGTRIDADFVVIASGSGYPYPAKMDLDDTAQAIAKLAETRAAIADAESVLLVGAGPVGIEFAGEITDVWPGKQVTIVDVAPDLLGGEYSQDLRDTLRDQLAARGVRLELGAPLSGHPPVPPATPSAFTVTTTAGAVIEAGIWFRCYGVVPASDFLAGGLVAARRADGFIEVDDHLRVNGHATVFAVGDVTAIPESKRGSAAAQHARVVAANILSLAAGEPADETYRPGPPGILVPIGATGGAAEFRRPEGPTMLGPELTAQYKGQDLMVTRYAEIFDAPPPPSLVDGAEPLAAPASHPRSPSPA